MKSRFTTKCICISSMLVIILLSINTVSATPISITSNFIRLSDLQNTGIDLFVSSKSLEQDLTKGDFDLKIFFDGRLLLRGKEYPQNIKIEIYTLVEEKKNFVSILNRTIKNNKAAENIFLITKLPRITESTELYFDIYDANNILKATYKTNITINSSDSPELSAIESIDDYDCQDGDGECLIEYILRNLSFSASYDRNLKTEVIKNTKGRYTVSIPIKKGRTLKSKVRKIGSSTGGKTNGIGSGKLADPYPYFQNDVEVASSYWDELREALKIKFTNSGNEFNFKKDGALQLSTNIDKGFLNLGSGTTNKAPIVFNQGQMLTDLVDGALEYDGQDLYFTSGSTRKIISQAGPQGPAGPAGAPGPIGPAGPAASGVDLSNGGFLNGTINFINESFIENASFNGYLQYKTGANNGLVLTSDANGNATWQPIMILINSTVLSTGPLGSVQFAGVSNGFNFDYNNFFWDDSNNRLGLGTNTPSSTLTVNGNFTLKDGTQAAGYLLTSDANGNATWTSFTSLPGAGDITSVGNCLTGACNDFTLTAATTATIPLSIRATAGQTANLTQWQNGSGGIIASIDADGDLRASNTFTLDGIAGDTIITTPTSSGYGYGIDLNSVSTAFSSIAIFGDATGQYSTAVGGGVSSGHSSVALGVSSIAGSQSQVSIGRFAGNISGGYNGGNYSVLLGNEAQASANEFGVSHNINNQSFWHNYGGFQGIQRVADLYKSSPHAVSRTDYEGQLDIRVYENQSPLTGLSVRAFNGTTITRVNDSFIYDDGSQANGYILTSDANGLASWQNPASLLGSGASASGIAGAIQFSDGSNGFNSNATNLFWNNTNGSLGIGTNIPNAPLTISKLTTIANQKFFTVNVNGSEIASLQEGILPNYGGSLALKDAAGAGNYVRLAYSASYPKLETNRTSLTLQTSTTQQRLASTYIDFIMGTQTPLIMQNVGPTATFTSTNSTNEVLIVKGASNQNNNLTEWQDFNGNTLVSISASGALKIADGTQATNYVLTSDANGLASWQNIFTVINGGTFSDRVILNTVAISGGNMRFGVIENGVDTFGWQDINNGRLVLKAKAPHAQTLTITPRGNGGGVPTLESNTGQVFIMPTAGGNQYNGFEFSNNGLNIRNQMTPQRILLANNWSSASGGINHEYTSIGWNNNTFHIETVNGGTGVTRNIMFSAPVTTINGSIAIKDGTQAAGYVLTSDANGVASWQAPGGGGSGSASGISGALQFSDGSNGFNSDAANLFWDNTSKRLGIGTAPSATLDVAGAARVANTNDSTGAIYAVGNSTGTNDATGIQGRVTGNTNATKIAIAGVAASGGLGEVVGVYGAYNYPSGSSKAVAGIFLSRYTAFSNVGNYIPENSALIASNHGSTHAIFLGLDDTTTVFKIADGGNVGIRNTNPNARLAINTVSATEQGLILKAAAAQTANLTEWQNSIGTQLSLIDSNGYMAINKAFIDRANGAALDVNGSIFSSGFRLQDGTQAAGYVLTSDANGLASWQASASGAQWIDNGTTTYVDDITDDIAFGGTNSSAPIFIDTSDASVRATNFRGTIFPTSPGGYSWSWAPHSGGASIYGGAFMSGGNNVLQVRGSLNRRLLFRNHANTDITILEMDNGDFITSGEIVSESAVINGSLQVIDGTQANGYVLTSDANGLASWQAPAAGDITSVGDCLTGACNTITFTAVNNSTIPITIRGAVSQTANLQEWQNANGTVLAKIDASGNATIAGTTGGALYFGNNNHYITANDATNTMSFAPSLGTITMSLTNANLIVGVPNVTGGDGQNMTFRSINRGGNTGNGLNTTLRAGDGSSSGTPTKGGDTFVHGGHAIAGNNNGGSVYIYGGSKFGSGLNGDILLAHNGSTERGNVGVGTSTPQRKLHISEAMRLEPQSSPPASPSTGDIYIDSDGTQAACVYLNGSWEVMAGTGTCS